MVNFYEKMKEYHEKGQNIDNALDYKIWTDSVEAYLSGCGEEEYYDVFFLHRSRAFSFYEQPLINQLAVIEGLLTVTTPN